MNYEKAWKELKDIIKNNYEDEVEALLRWRHGSVLNNMEKLEEKHDDRNLCIKDKDTELIAGKKYEVTDQDRYYVCVNGENDEQVYLTYDEFFEEYFEVKKD